MVRANLGGEIMPAKKDERLKFLEEKKVKYMKILDKLIKKEHFEYKPKSGLF